MRILQFSNLGRRQSRHIARSVIPCNCIAILHNPQTGFATLFVADSVVNRLHDMSTLNHCLAPKVKSQYSRAFPLCYRCLPLAHNLESRPTTGGIAIGDHIITVLFRFLQTVECAPDGAVIFATMVVVAIALHAKTCNQFAVHYFHDAELGAARICDQLCLRQVARKTMNLSLSHFQKTFLEASVDPTKRSIADLRTLYKLFSR